MNTEEEAEDQAELKQPPSSANGRATKEVSDTDSSETSGKKRSQLDGPTKIELKADGTTMTSYEESDQQQTLTPDDIEAKDSHSNDIDDPKLLATLDVESQAFIQNESFLRGIQPLPTTVQGQTNWTQEPGAHAVGGPPRGVWQQQRRATRVPATGRLERQVLLQRSTEASTVRAQFPVVVSSAFLTVCGRTAPG